MEWVQPKRRGPLQGLAGQTLGSVSSPPPQLLTIFGIVIALLWFSQHTGNEESQMFGTPASFQLVLFLLPILLLFFMSSYSMGGLINFRFRQLPFRSTR